MLEKLFRINTPLVVSEIIDGEVVIMNLKVGNYYSTDGAGAVLWQWLEAGEPVANLVDLAQNQFVGEADTIQAEIIEFVGDLLKEELVTPVEEAESGDSNQRTATEMTQPPTPFKTPKLHVYEDMQDLLLLDPIHDVSEVGWPVPKTDIK